MKYLGKKYLHQFLIKKGYNPPLLKSMAYGKYRGDEWLKNEILDVFCVQGNTIFVSELLFDEELDGFFEISRYRYDLINGEWIKNYERIRNKRS